MQGKRSRHGIDATSPVQDIIDEDVAESFPASDPPAYTVTTGTTQRARPRATGNGADSGERRGLRVVVVGAGFGGLAAAKRLATTRLERAPVRVTVIDRANHHVFQPLLYQVATAQLSSSEVAIPIRRAFRGRDNVEVLMDEVTAVDTVARRVLTSGQSIAYDHLVLATGCEYAYFGHDDWRRDAPGLKTIDDALEIRHRVLLAFERAENAASAEERRRLMTFVVVGGGPTGVELAGAIADLARRTLPGDFRRIEPRAANIVVVEALPILLAGFSERLSAFAIRALEGKGVSVRLETPVEHVSADGVIAKGKRIPAATVLWAAATRADGPGRWIDAETDKTGRVKVNSDLSVPGHPELFVIGDAAHVEGKDGKPLPGLAAVAKQQGEYVAEVIARRAQNEASATAPYRYRDYGVLATTGRGAAVADLRWIRVKGRIGWIVWGLVHIYFLSGFRNRLLVFLKWLWSYLTTGRGARVIVQTRRGVGLESDRRRAPERKTARG